MSLFTITLIIFLAVMPLSNSRSTNVSNPRPVIESNSIRHHENSIGRVVIKDSKALKRVFLSNRTVTCNDGSQAGFYLRKSSKSKRWVVFFEGGWYCYDTESCKARWTKFRHLMTSAKWPETREDLGGILSAISSENPYWHDANHVLVPYCSSDSWSGTKITEKWRFMGSLIVRQVIADLIPLGLGRQNGGELLLAGSSAGGLGVMLNLDKVKSYLREERGMRVAVRGVCDSGWFLDREPYATGAMSTSEVVRRGWRLWGGTVPDACRDTYRDDSWKCYFGHRLYSTLKSPLFIFQWLYDEAQMRADSVGTPVTKKQWDYIHNTGIALRASLDNVTAVFAPSCIGHSVLTKRDWVSIKIDDISLPEALRCWERATELGGKEPSRRGTEKKLNRRDRRKNEINKRKNKKNKKQEQHRRRLERRQQQRQRNGRKIRNQEQMTLANEFNSSKLDRFHIPKESATNNINQNKKRRNHLPQNRNINKNRNINQNRINNHNKHHKRRHNQNGGHQSISEPTRCSLRLIEKCTWPQCNHSCPSITNPLTGKEMRFLELLASFGLDIDSVATAMGINMTTLSNMDRAELLNLLTENS